MPTRIRGDAARIVETVSVIDVLAPTSAPHEARPKAEKPASDTWRSMVRAADSLLGAASSRDEPRIAAADDLELTPALLSEAIIEWTGKSLALREPDRETVRLVALYGRDAQRIVRSLRRLQAEFDETQRRPGETRWLAADRAAAAFSSRHPELSHVAVEALRWCYAFDRQHRCELHGVEL